MTSSNDNIFEELLQHNRDKEIYKQAIQYAFNYLDTVRDRPVFSTEPALAALEELNHPCMPEHPVPIEGILRQLHTIGAPATVAQGGGRYFGSSMAVPSPVHLQRDSWQMFGIRMLVSTRCLRSLPSWKVFVKN